MYSIRAACLSTLTITVRVLQDIKKNGPEDYRLIPLSNVDRSHACNPVSP